MLAASAESFMLTRFALSSVVLLLATSVLPAQANSLEANSLEANSLELVRDNAVAAIVLRSPVDLGRRGDQVLSDAKIEGSFRPSQIVNLLQLGLGLLGVQQGADFDGAFAAMIFPDPAGERVANPELFLRSFVVMVPFTDREQMAKNFGFGKAELPDGKVTRLMKRVGNSIEFVAMRDKHIYLAASEAVLEQALKGRPVAGQVTKAQRESFGTADLLIYVNPRPLKKDWLEFRKDTEDRLAKLAEEPEDKKVVQQLVRSLDDFKFFLGAARLDKGVGLQVLAAFDEQGAAAKDFLGSLRPEQPAHFEGLPQERRVAAYARAGTNARTKLLGRALADFFLRELLQANRLTSEADRPTMLGVLNEVWRRVRGSRVGLYLTSDEARLGLFSVVAVLDTKDAGEFVTELRTLARIGDGTLDPSKPDGKKELDVAKLVRDLSDARYTVRAPATTKLRLIGEPAVAELEKAAKDGKDLETMRRAQRLLEQIGAVSAERRKELLKKDVPRFVRPTFGWVAKAESRLGQPVDIVHVKLKDEAAAGALKQYFGPDWDKLRLAVRGQQVVLLLGSETALFEETLKNIESGKAVAAAGQGAATLARIQVSVDALASLVTGGARRLPGKALPSLTLSVPSSGVQLDVFVPAAELKSFVERKMR
jgi:hypothetical protein